MAFDFTDPRSYTRRAPLYELAFVEAGLALATQERILADLRTRGAGLAGTATVTTTIFGGLLATAGPFRPTAFVAVAAFVGVGLCALALLWPRHLVEVTNAERILAEHAEPRCTPLPLVHRELAVHRAEAYVRNRRTIDRLVLVLRLGLALLALHVLAWVATYAEAV